MTGRPGNTRERIVDVAMRMFVEQGYDGSSLREIAEAIDVTKAALYYHFRTKEDIVAEAFDAHAHRVQDLVEWLESVDPGDARDDELLTRLEALFAGESGLVMRFGQVNQAVMAREEFGARHREAMGSLIDGLTRGENGVEGRLRSVLAFAAIVLGTATDESTLTLGGSEQERRTAALRVARGLLTAPPTAP